ncbi:hypothetical protein L228DRAFT_241819 [Xylona heveae TC161]|uniref:Uncharacterized protein n=1 Tax=Xylona heveae (strain CBS 132557 / TC161) TaxID=1328760 RepID=A0A164ZIG7_XYLHT|nr:hypothetical protein L228DRAFT_241819 [Xylona heveae TC161]KZF19141.1 hypothetical protein L228DRAFT_241819 [Xylona heveae TC161]
MESSATSEKHSSRPYAHKRSSTLQSISSFLGGGAGNSKRESASPRAALASIPAPADDEFLNLDINTALFPNGSSDPAASPHAFRDLVSNAEATILRIQTAYKLRTMALHDISAEKSAQADELEESQTRARHLKMQLDDLSAKVSEQERTMKELAEELSAERQRRYEEEEARKRTITLVKKPASIPMDGGDNNDNKTLAATKRISRASDSGFESEDESCAESVFSRVHDRADAASPAGTMFTSASGLTSPVELVSSSAPFPLFSSSSPSVQKPPNEHAEDKPDDPSVTPTQRSSIPPQRSSAFQKMLRGIGATSMAKAAEAGLGGCANCRGEDASMAWNIVGHLREENAELNTRVGQLEGAVENCLDIVKGLHV